MRRQVAITGLGAVSSLGVGFPALWNGLLAGTSALGPITRFDASGFHCRLAGEVKDFSAKDHVPKHYRKAVKIMARDIELAVAAAKEAAEDAGLITRANLPEGGTGETTFLSERFGCHIGAALIAADTQELTSAMTTAVRAAGDRNSGDSSMGGFSLNAWGTEDGGEEGMNNLTPLWLLKYLPNMLASHVTIIHGAEGPSNTITCNEASGLLSISESLRVIQRGAADICFSGGAESNVNFMRLIRLLDHQLFKKAVGRLRKLAPVPIVYPPVVGHFLAFSWIANSGEKNNQAANMANVSGAKANFGDFAWIG